MAVEGGFSMGFKLIVFCGLKNKLRRLHSGLRSN